MSYIKEIRKFIGHAPMLSAGATVIVQKDGKILLNQRSDTGTWGIPGGALELGETLEQTAGRLRGRGGDRRADRRAGAEGGDEPDGVGLAAAERIRRTGFLLRLPQRRPIVFGGDAVSGGGRFGRIADHRRRKPAAAIFRQRRAAAAGTPRRENHGVADSAGNRLRRKEGRCHGAGESDRCARGACFRSRAL